MKLLSNSKYLLFVLFIFFMNFELESRDKKKENRTVDPLIHVYSNYLEQTDTYNLATGLYVAALYVASCPSFSRDDSVIEEGMDDIGYLIAEDGDIIRCMRSIGEVMVRQGMENFDFNNVARNQVRGNVLNMANNAGLDNAGIFADKVVTSMRNEQLQPIIIGQELIWLSKVLPSAAEGDWDDYYNTGSIFRRQAQQQVIYYKNILQMFSGDPEAAELIGVVLPLIDKWSTQYGVGYILGVGVHYGVISTE